MIIDKSLSFSIIFNIFFYGFKRIEKLFRTSLNTITKMFSGALLTTVESSLTATMEVSGGPGLFGFSPSSKYHFLCVQKNNEIDTGL